MDFEISVSPAGFTLDPGASATTTVTVHSLGSDLFRVTLRLGDIESAFHSTPVGFTIGFSQNPVFPACGSYVSSQATLFTSSSTAPDAYTVPIWGIGEGSTGALAHSASLLVRINGLTQTPTTTQPPTYSIATTTTTSSSPSGPSPTIAGFTVESIIAGIALGLVTLTVIRGRRARKHKN